MRRHYPHALLLAGMLCLDAAPALSCDPEIFLGWTNPPNFSSVALDVADVNLDGIPDLVNATAVCNNMGMCTAAQIHVQLGVGDGTFSTPIVNALTDQQSRIRGLEIGDFTGDGKPDWVTVYTRSSADWVVLQRGDGLGGITSQVTTGLNSNGAALGGHGDFNGDGRLDLLLGSRVVLGNGTGGFAFQVTPLPLAAPFVVRDLNHDDRPDLVKASSATDEVSVLLGNGDGTFVAAPTVPVGDDPRFVRAKDLNGDGHSDLVTANFNAGTVSVAFGHGDGTFDSAVHYFATTTPTNLDVADLDGNGWLDVVVVGRQNPIAILRNQGDGTLAEVCGHYHGAMLPSQLPIEPAIARDLNGDHKPDLVFPFLNNAETRAEVHLNVIEGTPLAVPPQAEVFFTAGPNPAFGEVRFHVGLEQPDRVRLDVFDASGRRVARVFEGSLPAGSNIVSWSPRSSHAIRGVFWAKLSTSRGATTRRMVWLVR